MTNADFLWAVGHILDAEGVLADDKRDPGGRTKYGISWKFHEKELRAMFGISSIDEITRDQAVTFYRVAFWDVCRCGDLPRALALMVFDAAVMSAPEDAIRWLQQAAGAHVDGICGPQTIAAASVAVRPRLIGKFQRLRLEHVVMAPGADFDGGWIERFFRLTAIAGV